MKSLQANVEFFGTIPYVFIVNPVVRSSLRFLRQILVAVAVALLFWTLLIMLFEDRFIFFPSSYPSGPYAEAASVRNLEDCWFTAEDGVRLHGWLLRADSAIATLVMAHGNAGNLAHRLPILLALRGEGFNVFMFDYRGYGRSEGSPSEEGVYKDGRAAFDYIHGRQDLNDVPLILFGTSLGGAVAVDVALQRPAAAMVLESTFSSAKDVARSAYPFLPARFLLRSRFASDEKIKHIHIPLLFLHGTDDGIIPLSLGRKLYTAANQPKRFYEIAGADHNDTFWVGGAAYLEEIRRFGLSVSSHRRSD